MKLQGPDSHRKITVVILLLGLAAALAFTPVNSITGNALTSTTLSPSPDNSSATSTKASTESTNSLQNGLEAYYRFDNVKASRGYSLEFDGSDDYVEVPASSSLNISSSVTVSGWVRFHQSGQSAGLFGRGIHTGACSDRGPYFIGTYNPGSGSRLWWTLGNGSSCSTVSDSFSYDVGKWYHIAGVWDGTTSSGSQKLYVNGQKVGETSPSFSNLQDRFDVTIGAKGFINSYLDGEIDSVKIYNRSLTGREVEKIYQEEVVSKDRLAAYYNFNSGPSYCDLTGTNSCLKDISSKENNGNPLSFNDNTIDSGSGWTIETPINRPSMNDHSKTSHTALLYGSIEGDLKNFDFDSSSGWTEGKIGDSALKFDGKDDKIVVERSPKLNITKEITLAAWVKVNDTAKWPRIIEKGNYDSYQLRIGQNQQATMFVCAKNDNTSNCGKSTVGSGSGSVPPGEWTHLVGTWDGNTAKIYVNGSLEGQTTYDYDSLKQSSQPLTIADTYNLNGTLDDLRAYKTSLDSSEVTSLYNGKKVDTDLVGKWSLEEGDRKKIYDTSVLNKGITKSNSYNLSGSSLNSVLDTERNFSIGLWAKVAENATGALIQEREAGSYQISVDDNKLEATVMASGSRKKLSTSIGSGRFYHISLGKSGEKASLYVDGEKEDEASLNQSMKSRTTNTVYGARKILWSENGESCIARNWETTGATVNGSQLAYSGECSITCQGNGGEDCAEKGSQVSHPDGIVEWYVRAPSGNDTRRMEINLGGYSVNSQAAALTFEADGEFGSSNGSWWNVNSGVDYQSNKWYLFRIDYKDNLSGVSGTYNVTVEDPKTGQTVWEETDLIYNEDIHISDGARWQFHRIDDQAWVDNIRWYAEEKFRGTIDEAQIYNTTLPSSTIQSLAFK